MPHMPIAIERVSILSKFKELWTWQRSPNVQAGFKLNLGRYGYYYRHVCLFSEVEGDVKSIWYQYWPIVESFSMIHGWFCQDARWICYNPKNWRIFEKHNFDDVRIVLFHKWVLKKTNRSSKKKIHQMSLIQLNMFNHSRWFRTPGKHIGVEIDVKLWDIQYKHFTG